MGFNISGIAFSTNLKENKQLLEEKLGFQIEFEKDISFEEAFSNFKDEHFVDICFSDNGTLVFMSEPPILKKNKTLGISALTFGVNETSMAFLFDYFKNGDEVRSKVVYNYEIMSEKGEMLEAERNSEDVTEQVFQLINEVSGFDLNTIDLGRRSQRYKILKPQVQSTHSSIEDQADKKVEVKDIISSLPKDVQKLFHQRKSYKTAALISLIMFVLGIFVVIISLFTTVHPISGLLILLVASIALRIFNKKFITLDRQLSKMGYKFVR